MNWGVAQRWQAKAALILALASAPTAIAGVYIQPTVAWGQFAARPEQEEATPNYSGLGLGLSFGYSLLQIWDLGFYETVQSSGSDHGQIAKRSASLVSYGGETGLRLGNSVYVGVRGGAGTYELPTSQSSVGLAGQWNGLGGGVFLGAVRRLDKSKFLQATLGLSQYVLNDASTEARGKRRFDAISFGLSFMYNSETVNAIEESPVLRNFLDHLVF